MEKVVLEIGGPSYLCPQDLCKLNKPKKSDWCVKGGLPNPVLQALGCLWGASHILCVSVSPLLCMAGVGCGREPLFYSHCLDKNPDSP